MYYIFLYVCVVILKNIKMVDHKKEYEEKLKKLYKIVYSFDSIYKFLTKPKYVIGDFDLHYSSIQPLWENLVISYYKKMQGIVKQPHTAIKYHIILV